MSQDLVIGIDSSTTATKVIAWNGLGHALAEGRSAIPLNSPQANHYEQDPQNWWLATAEALRQLNQQIDPARIAAIAISNQRETFVPLDKDFQALRPGIVWLDERCKAEAPWLAEQVGYQRIHEISGKPMDITPVVYRIAWMVRNEPELVKQTACFADVHTYLALKLTGECTTSWASADPMGCFDLEHKHWSSEILDKLDIATEQFPKTVAPGTVIGQVTAQAAEATGLITGTPLVTGGGDGQCAGLGCNVLSSEHAYLNLGTAVVSGVYGRQYLTDRAFRTMGSCSGDGYIYETCLRSGTFLVNWFVEQVFGADPNVDQDIYQRLEQEAAKLPIGADGLLLVPYWSGVMTPYWELDARGTMVGFSAAHTRSHMYRAMMEGIALEQAMVTSQAEQVTGMPVKSYLAIGGGAASDVWCQIVADCANKTVERLATVEASNLGAAMDAALGAGWFNNVADAAQSMRGETLKTFEPITTHVERYAKLMEVYREVHLRLRDIYKPLKAATE